MSGVFEIDLASHELPLKKEKSKEPQVPNRALLVVQFGVPYLLYYQGTGLSNWFEDLRDEQETAHEMIPGPCADGVFVWQGKVQHARTQMVDGDEWDEWLTGDVRVATAAEWKAFTRNEIVWDQEAMGAWLTYDQS